MSHIDPVKKINELISLAEVIPYAKEYGSIPYRSFGIKEYNISFIGIEKYRFYQSTLELLYALNKDICHSWSVKSYENKLIVLIRDLKSKGEECTKTVFKEFHDSFLRVDLVESEILFDIHGIYMSVPKIQLGEFTIYNFDQSYAELVERYPYLSNKDFYFKNRKSKYLIGIKVKARENSKATEIATNLLLIFENVVSYMIADLSRLQRVGIINFKEWKTSNIVICNSQSMGSETKNDVYHPVNLDDKFFIDPSQGNSLVWPLITNSTKTDIEKRLLNTIEWIGKALRDEDNAKSLVQFVFAVEGMLQVQDRTIITPSIISQLSDWLAFIIQDDQEKRKEIAKYFKAIYQKRSAIAHGASSIVDINDLSLALQISKHMVITFLVTDPFNTMKTMDELSQYMTDLKFK